MSHALEKGHILKSDRRNYRIEQKLGQGGFGITYLASTQLLVGNVTITGLFAIKEHFVSSDCEREANSSRVVYSNPAKDRVEKSRTDFIAEAHRLQNISSKNDNIVKVNEVFEANNTAYYVMEYLKGESLADYVKSHGKLSEGETLAIMTPIAEALRTLHSNQTTHLDLKPENIMLVKKDSGELRPVLIDFGLSKHYDDEGNPTSTINILGCSDGYSPMEQYSGIDSFSPEADIYAFGATIYFSLTGERPDKSTNLKDGELADKIAGTVSKETEEVVRKATRASKFDRANNISTLMNLPERVEPDKQEITVDNQKKEAVKQEHESHKQSKVTVIINDNADEDKPKKGFPIKLIAVIIGGLLIGCGLFFLFRSGDNDAAGDDDEIEMSSSRKKAMRVEAVDLGLPSGTRWAATNIGGNSEIDYGDYFAWGELRPKKEFTESNYRQASYPSNISGDPDYDAATFLLGGKWRIPTQYDFQELMDYCHWSWIENDGKSYYMITGPNGNMIYLPAAGFKDSNELSVAGEVLEYWTADERDIDNGYLFEATEPNNYLGHAPKFFGLSIRPVNGGNPYAVISEPEAVEVEEYPYYEQAEASDSIWVVE